MKTTERGISKSLAKEQGFVSIFSVLIIMAVLTLTVVGFSAVVRRAATTNLNDQLSTQAYYAAESGVNEVISYLKNTPAAPAQKTACTAPAITGISYGNNLDLTLKTGYTCILYGPSGADLQFKKVPVEGTGPAKVVEFSSTSAISSFDIKLSGNSAVAGGAGGSIDTVSTRGDVLGMLRVDLAPINNGYNRDNLTAGYTFFLDFRTLATTAGPFTVNSGANSGNLIHAKCNSVPCTATINLVGTSSAKYMMRLQSVYSPVDATINNVKDAGGSLLALINGQKVVDVTAQANGVYRRIQVRLPFTNNGLTPAFALETADSICKLLDVQPGNTSDGCGNVVAASGGPIITPPSGPPPCGFQSYNFDITTFVLFNSGPLELQLQPLTPLISACTGRVRLITRDDGHKNFCGDPSEIAATGCVWPPFNPVNNIQPHEQAYVVGCSDLSSCGNNPSAQTFITGMSDDIPDDKSDFCAVKIFNITVTGDTKSLWFRHMALSPNPAEAALGASGGYNSVHGGSIDFAATGNNFPAAPAGCVNYSGGPTI